MSKVSAEIDQIVSGPAWVAFPALHVAILRWADLVRSEAGGLLVSALPVGMDLISVRVTSLGEGDLPRDWVEWNAPTSLKGARQSAIDHFVSRSMATAMEHLEGGPRAPHPAHNGTHPPAVAPGRAGLSIPTKEAPNMAKKKSPAAATSKPAPSPARTAAPRAETRSAVATPARTSPTSKPRASSSPTTPKPKQTRAAAKPAPAPAKPAREARAAKPSTTPAKPARPAKPAPAPIPTPKRGPK